MFQILFLFLLPLLDRMRGDKYPPVPRPIVKALMGLACLIILTGTFDLPWQLFAACILGHMVGESFGWGDGIGAGLGKVSKTEWTAIKSSKNRDWYLAIPLVNYSWQTALAFRGVLWALIPAIGMWFYISPLAALIMIAAHSIGMAGGIYTQHALNHRDDKVATLVSKLSFTKFTSEDRWAMQEIYRGFIIGIILLLGSNFSSM